MSGFNPSEYERTGGMYDSDPEPITLSVFDRALDPESRFARDLGAFCRINTMLHEQAVADLATDVPDDFVAITNTGITAKTYLAHEGTILPDALNSGYLSYLALKRIGYQVLAVGEDGDRDNNIKAEGQIAIYRNLLEHTPFSAMIKDGRCNLPHYINNNTFDRALERGHSLSWHEAPMVSGWADTGMLERGFMTGTLLLAKEHLAGRGLESLNVYRAKCIDIYDKLVAEGYTPLGPEELAGIVESSIRTYIEDHPDYAPLSQQ